MITIFRVAEKLAIALFSSIYMDYDRPATVGVISATQIDIVQAVFWDGEKIINPCGCQNVDRS